MLRALANYIIDQKINALSSKVKKNFVGLDSAQNVVMLLNSRDFDTIPVKKFIYEIDKKVELIVYHNDTTSVKPLFLSVNKKDLNILGIPKTEVFNKLKAKEFDILVDCNFNNATVFKALSGMVNARCKVGTAGLSYEDVFDIRIGLGKEATLENYFEQVINYLKMIKR